MVTNVDSFVLSLPDEWSEVPSDPDELVASVSAALQRKNPGALDLPEVRRSLLVLKRMAQNAVQGGIVFTAVTDQLIDVEPDSAGDPFVLTALCWLGAQTLDGVQAGQVSFDQLRLGVEAEDVPQRLETPRVVELEAGPAVRDVALRPLVAERAADEIPMLHVSYHLLIGSGEGVAVLGFATPNVELAEELVGLFEAIASTLELVAA